jgi:pterin-4a-carbinolamine dehydratase
LIQRDNPLFKCADVAASDDQWGVRSRSAKGAGGKCRRRQFVLRLRRRSGQKRGLSDREDGGSPLGRILEIGSDSQIPSERSSERNASSVGDLLAALRRLIVRSRMRLTSSLCNSDFGHKKAGLTARAHTCPGGPVAKRGGESGEGGKRKVKFATFRDAIRFMRLVALGGDIADHHPRWENIYRTLRVHFTTLGYRAPHHRPGCAAGVLPR